MDTSLRDCARQDLQTLRAFGVDFVPVRAAAQTRTAAAKPSQHAQDKQRALSQLHQQHDEACPHCTKATYHTQTVFGEGDPDADLMFIGEAPGEEEDKTGRPFVGRAGQKLDSIIQAMTLQREDVYIANVLKSRPPENRTPLQPEVDACGVYLVEQIRIIQPRVIVTLGGPATKLVLKTDVGITRLRGVWSEYADPKGEFVIPVMPTFHPAYLLRNYTPETRKQVWSDMQQVMDRLGLKH
ncbi:MAG TPA: uracil-DNA glycosylase [Phycisphaerales bacterium]|nr:uracil-DNA glycosylase [Phycisphaerales bacterium]